MRRTHLGMAAVTALALATAGGTGIGAEEPRSVFGFKGVVEVRELVIVYSPGSPATVRAHLVTGVMIEDEIKAADAIAHVLQISSAFAQPRARLAVTLEGGRIEAFHLATGVGSSRGR